MILDVTAKSEIQAKFSKSKRKKHFDADFEFFIMDSTKWPIKVPDFIVSFPRQVKDALEEFTQMYERQKKGTQTQQKKDDKQRAIILTWDIRQGDCQLSTYALSDPEKRVFTIELSCLHGLLLLNFNSDYAPIPSLELTARELHS